MDNEIGSTLDGMVENPLKVIEKIESPSSALYARPDRIIKTQVGIGE